MEASPSSASGRDGEEDTGRASRGPWATGGCSACAPVYFLVPASRAEGSAPSDFASGAAAPWHRNGAGSAQLGSFGVSNARTERSRLEKHGPAPAVPPATLRAEQELIWLLIGGVGSSGITSAGMWWCPSALRGGAALVGCSKLLFPPQMGDVTARRAPTVPSHASISSN